MFSTLDAFVLKVIRYTSTENNARCRPFPKWCACWYIRICVVKCELISSPHLLPTTTAYLSQNFSPLARAEEQSGKYSIRELRFNQRKQSGLFTQVSVLLLGEEQKSVGGLEHSFCDQL